MKRFILPAALLLCLSAAPGGDVTHPVQTLPPLEIELSSALVVVRVDDAAALALLRQQVAANALDGRTVAAVDAAGRVVWRSDTPEDTPQGEGAQ